jgi:hypothetical protein
MVLIGALGLAAGAQAQSVWAEHVIYSPRTGENVVSVALAPLSAPNTSFAPVVVNPDPVLLGVQDFYVVFEVEDPSHKLYLQKWNGTAFWAHSVELDSGPIGILYNPSITTRAGHVTISAHYDASGCIGLREYDYDTATGTIDDTREIDNGNEIPDPAGNCEDVGHSHIVWSAADSTYHVCWTRKEGGGAGDEVYCSKRVETANSWDAPGNICGGPCSIPNNQDHSTIAINSLGSRRLAYHDQTTNVGINDNEAMLALYKPLGSKVTYRLPPGTAPQPGWQDRPFIALDGDGKIHGAWEAGPNGSEVIQYARCVNSTPNGCDAAAEWEFNNVAISEAGAVRARFPHLMIANRRTWISYEQVSNGTNDVVVLYRCLGVPNGDAWTISDPYPADDRDEYTEEYGTPHIAARATGVSGIFASQVGTVTLRRIPKTIPVRYQGILYTRSDPPCS